MLSRSRCMNGQRHNRFGVMRTDLNGLPHRKGVPEPARPRRRCDRMRRRPFVTVLARAAGWPIAGYAQPAERMRRVAVLMPGPENDWHAHATAFADAPGRLGWSDGRNFRLEYRYAANDPRLFKSYAEELVGLAPDALLATTPPALIALREKTRTIPIFLCSWSIRSGGAWFRASHTRAATSPGSAL
jgi:hypothetical protein